MLLPGRPDIMGYTETTVQCAIVPEHEHVSRASVTAQPLCDRHIG